VLEDLNSTNGVYIKSKRVRRQHLNDGDVVVLGKHEIMYLDERPARSRLAALEPTGDHEAIEESVVREEPATAPRRRTRRRPRCRRRSGAAGCDSRDAGAPAPARRRRRRGPNTARIPDQVAMRHAKDAATAATPITM
jgi:pSer/pThr/pTyr-binding forkhead associated (FHA) protein